MTLRSIQAMDLGAISKASKFGKRPELRWVAPTSLWVDKTYQRDLSKKSITLIKGMVKHFSWDRMKPPIVNVIDGKIHVVDGQHTAIAAATLGIEEIPVFVVESASEKTRALAFVGHNTDRIVIAPVYIHKARLAACEESAVDVDAVCRRAGARIKLFNQSGGYSIGDTMAVTLITSLVKRRGVMRARQVLECLVKAKRAPISGAEITATEHILCKTHPKLDFLKLSMVVRIGGDKALHDARAAAHTRRTQAWRVLVDVWSKKLPVAT